MKQKLRALCSVVDCQVKAEVREWCHRHYRKWLRYGDPLIAFNTVNTAEKFWATTKPEGSCVIWTGALNKGYGCLKWEGKSVLAHRLAFFLRLGRWPDSDLRHLCNRRACILHAVEGTRSENMQDKVKAGNHQNMRRSHCLRGHPYDEINTYFNSAGYRVGCRACMKMQEAKRPARRRLKQLRNI